MKEYILLFDSGVGGLNLLKKCKRQLPNENYIYFVENKFAPLGNKSKSEITQIVCDDTFYLIKRYKIKMVVLACNTATSVCIKKLRKLINISVVGIEPAILPAVKSECRNILVLCTRATYKFNSLLKIFKNSDVKFHKSKHFAKLIDENIENLDNILPEIKNELKKYAKMSIDGIVIGCTHYSFIKPQIEKVFKNNVIFFEPYTAVCKNMEKILLNKQCINKQTYKSDLKILLSKKDNKFKSKIKHIIKNFD